MSKTTINITIDADSAEDAIASLRQFENLIASSQTVQLPEQLGTDGFEHSTVAVEPHEQDTGTLPKSPVAVDTATAYSLPDTTVPWDERINSPVPQKLVKPPHNWKKRRGVSDETVAAVEAELASVVIAPAAPVSPPPPAQQPTPPPPVPSTPATSTITTLPELVTALTAKGVTHTEISDVLHKHDVVALPLLDARRDLIPVIAAALGV